MMRPLFAILFITTLLAVSSCDSGAQASAARVAPTSTSGTPNDTAVLGGGCFWCLEAIFAELKGVAEVTSGYSGGNVDSPSYEEVCTGSTGHAEVVRVSFDSTVISYSDLLRIFFTVHDPTTLNRQGPDAGSQYRSAIYYRTREQQRVAEDIMEEIAAARIWDNPVVTELAPLGAFYPAEEYHQRYFERNPDQAYCAVVIKPKVLKFREKYFDLLRK